MNTRNVVWWGCFFSLGIWLQLYVSGVDLLAAGLVLTLQERNVPQTLCVLLALVLIQEGLGSLDFGACLLWYGFLIIFFFLGYWLFATENILFVVLFGFGAGITHYVIIRMMLALQYQSMNETLLQDESVLQALLLPVVWKVARLVRPWGTAREKNV